MRLFRWLPPCLRVQQRQKEKKREGDALDVSSLSLSLAFLREDMFLRSRPEWFRSSCSKSMGTLQNPLACASHSKQK